MDFQKGIVLQYFYITIYCNIFNTKGENVGHINKMSIYLSNSFLCLKEINITNDYSVTVDINQNCPGKPR